MQLFACALFHVLQFESFRKSDFLLNRHPFSSEDEGRASKLVPFLSAQGVIFTTSKGTGETLPSVSLQQAVQFLNSFRLRKPQIDRFLPFQSFDSLSLSTKALISFLKTLPLGLIGTTSKNLTPPLNFFA